jgi:histidinol-phosphate aminotransferase
MSLRSPLPPVPGETPGEAASPPLPARMVPEEPSEVPSELPAAAGGRDAIRLTSNENRLGLPESVRSAVLQAFRDAHIYPDDSCEELTVALAARHGVLPESIVHAHGSTELLRMAVPTHGVGRSRVRLVMPEPTFEQLAEYAEPFDPDVVTVPLTPDRHAHDLETMRRAAEAWGGPAIIYVCNPNNPTGTLSPVGPLKEWIAGAPDEHLFVVDEAYHDFVEDPEYESMEGQALLRPNLMVLRTFSKAYAMAGLCVGYAVAHPTLAARLKLFKTGRGPSHLSSRGALAALQDRGFLRRAIETNRTSREVVYQVLRELGLGYMESHTNFVMHEVGGPVAPYVERMREAGFLVGRPFQAYPTHNRITLGLPHEMAAWAETLRGFRRRGWV